MTDSDLETAARISRTALTHISFTALGRISFLYLLSRRQTNNRQTVL